MEGGGGLTRYQFLEAVVGKERGDLFQGAGGELLFLHKKYKLKSEIFNDKKKFINKNIFLS